MSMLFSQRQQAMQPDKKVLNVFVVHEDFVTLFMCLCVLASSMFSCRWHASANGSMPCCYPDGTPWYSDPLGPLFVAGIPPEEQQRWQEVRLKVGQ